MTGSTIEAELTVEQLGEFGLIDRLARLVAAAEDPLRPPPSGEVGIGDDAALWEPVPGHTEVLTTDALIEDVHFRTSTSSWEDLGWKALAVNVSDIAAMGAVPRRAFVTLGLRRGTRVADLDALYQGFAAFLRAYREYGLGVAGGDTVSSPVTMLSITVVGDLAGPGLRRSTGQPGDLLAVTGTLGDSAGGLALLELPSPLPGETPHPPPPSPARGRGGADGHLLPQVPAGREKALVGSAGDVPPLESEDPSVPSRHPLARTRARGAGGEGPPGTGGEGATLISVHRRPMPRVAEGLALAESGVRCGMDLSDGLMGDAGKLAYASGLAAAIDWPRLPLSPELSEQFGEEARSLALHGGEDYELLVAVPADVIERASALLAERGLRPLTVVGHLLAGEPGRVTVLDEQGAVVEVPGGSWDHFRAAEPAP